MCFHNLAKSDHWNAGAHTHSFSACEGQLYLLTGVTLKLSYITSYKSRFSAVCINKQQKSTNFLVPCNRQNTATGHKT